MRAATTKDDLDKTARDHPTSAPKQQAAMNAAEGQNPKQIKRDPRPPRPQIMPRTSDPNSSLRIAGLRVRGSRPGLLPLLY